MYKTFFVFLLTSLSGFAQLPDTDLWLVSLKEEKGNFKVEKAINITNRPGYDNQPSFSPDGKKIWYVSIREDKQADVYVYSTGDKKSTQFTKTPESEYSPVPYNQGIHCVVVEKDSAQRIWVYDEKTGVSKNKIFDEDSIGYYSFLNQDTILYYKLTTPHSLRARSVHNGQDNFIAFNPVRGFRAVNRHEFIFGIKDSLKVDFYKYQALLRKASWYCDYPSLSEDMIWHAKWGLLKSEGAAILRYDEALKKWEILFDLSSYGIKKITRFDFDKKNKKLVVVDNK